MPSSAQPLAYGSIFAGALLLIAGVTGSGIASVAQGAPDRARAVTPGSSPSSPSSSSPASSTPSGTAGPQPGGTPALKAHVGAVSKELGWDAHAWEAIIEKESGWDSTARNPSSGAFGLGQFLGSTRSEYRKYGSESHDPKLQLDAMAAYILKRYGNPTAALAFHRAHNWY